MRLLVAVTFVLIPSVVFAQIAPPETLRVFSKGLECMKDGVTYSDSEEFAKSHLRLKCVKGVIKYTGCRTDANRALAIGEEFVHRNVVHRCFGSPRFLQYAEHTCGYPGKSRC